MYHMPVDMLMMWITPHHFLELKAYYSCRVSSDEKTRMYLAKIAHIIACTNSEKPQDYKDFVIDFDAIAATTEATITGRKIDHAQQSEKNIRRELERMAIIYGVDNEYSGEHAGPE